MQNFNTQAECRDRFSSHEQVFKASPLPNEMKTRLMVKVVALLLCCFSFQSLFAQQCNIATPIGTNVNLYLGANGNTTLNSNVFIPYVSSPNCPGGNIEIWFDVNGTVPFPPTNYNCTNVGLLVPVFVTIEGPFGQSNAVLFTVNILDNAPPLVAWPANVTVPADPSACAAVVNSLTPVVTDNCPSSYTLTWVRSATTPGSGSNSANGIYNVGTTTITYTLVDSHGTPNQVHNTTVTVTDSQVPTITPSTLPNQTVSANGSCQASVTWNGGLHPIASDNCALMFPPGLIYTIQMSGATTLPAQNPTGVALPFTFNKGVTTVTYTAFDGVNTTVLSFTVTVNDTTAPSFGTPTSILNVGTVTCVAPVNLIRTATDNCDPMLDYTFTVTANTGGPSPFVGVQAGNNASGNYPVGQYTVVFSAFDGINTGTHTVTLTVADNINPVAICQNITVDLAANGMVTVNAIQLNNGSTDNCGVTTYQIRPDPPAGSPWLPSLTYTCADQGPHPVQFRVLDGGGNNSTICNATITVQDNLPPTPQCQNITVDLNLPAGPAPTNVDVFATQINNGSFDNCTASGSLNLRIRKGTSGPFQPIGVPVNFNCSEVGNNIVELRVGDFNGNPNFCTATVKVRDVTPPVAVAMPFVAVLSATPSAGSVLVTPANINNGSSDNCGIVKYEISRTSSTTGFSQTGVTFTCADLAVPNPETVWLRVMDAGDGTTGNSHVVSTTVTVQDNTNPTAVCQPAIVQLNNSGNGTLTPAMVNGGSFDNCSFTMSVSPNTFNCGNIGSNPVTLTATDGSGNMNSCMTTVTVQDNVPPVATCQNLTVALQSNGEVEVFAIQTTLTSFDVCCGLFLPSEISVNGSGYAPSYNFDCTEVGVNNVSARVFDCHGNSAICTSTITIEDTEDPVITCPSNLTVQCSDDLTPTNTGSATATDNCPTPTILAPVDFIDPLNVVCVGTYEILRTWTAEDNYGNTSSCVQTITVEDTTIPTFTAPADVVLDCPGSYTVANQFCNSFPASAGLPLAISPLSSGVYLASLNINVPSNGKIMDLNVTNLKIEHTWVGDLQVELISPLGTPILIGNFNACGNVDDINLSLDDEAMNALNCGLLNLGQTFQPSNSLSAFDGQMVNGTWTLRITDNANFDGGALVSWGLEVCYVTQPQDLSLSGDVTDEADNCDTPQATFADFHAYKDFINHGEGSAYNFSSWAASAPGNSSVTSTTDMVTLVSDNSNSGSLDATFTFASIPANGFIVFDWDYNTTDFSPFFDPFGYAINGVINFVPLVETGFGGLPAQSGRAIIPVFNGDSFAFVQNTTDGLFGPATTVVTNFLFYNNDMPVPIDGCERKFCVARVWNLSDNCGNAAAKQVQIIETRDITAPVVNYPTTKNVLAQNGVCNPLVDLNLTNFISDACSNFDDLTITNDALANYGKGNGTFDASGFYSPGSYTITFTVTDECGNTNIHTIALTVTDSQNPTAICQNATVQLDNSGTAIVTPASINNGSYDNCSITSMVVTPNTFTIANIGANNVTLTVTDPSGNTNSCSAVVTVLGGVMFDAGDAAGATGNTVLVPVTVTNFNNIISFELDIDISAGTVATVNAIEGIHPSLAGMLFPITGPTHVDVSWIGGPVNLPSGTVAFNVRVNLIGTTGSSTPILVNVVEVGTPSGITPSLGLSGTISIIDPGTLYQVSGTLVQHVNSGNGQVHLADVDYFGSVSGTIPNAPGAFSFNVPSGSNITVEPSKDINWNNGVSTLDALCAHYYSIGLPLPGACTGPVTPYQKIAADANGNNAVTAFDAALIQQIAINNTPVVGNTSWRFVPTVPALPADPFVGGFDETISYTNITGNITNANFYGIKTGDVSAPFANGVTNFGGDTGERSSNLNLQVSDAAVTEGQDIAVNFKSNGFTGIYSMQTTFNFDPSVLEFVGASGNELASIIFNNSMVAEGKLAASWYNLDAVTMENGENLFTLHFKAKGSGVLSDLLSTSADMVMQEVATATGDVIGVDIVFESFTATGEQVIGHFALHQNRPNPFSTRTAIGFNLPTADHAALTITDAAGKTLKVLEGNFTSGYHQFMIERSDLPATGVFFYQLKTADFQAVKKMILVD